MTWIKLDDRAPRHPKIAGLSDRAFRWWIRGLCYASEFLTDGDLAPAFWQEVPPSTREELVRAGLWLINAWEPGALAHYVIHDYLIHQTPRANVEKERERNRRRARGSTGGTPSGTTSGSTAGTLVVLPQPEYRVQSTDHSPLPPSRGGRSRKPKPIAKALPPDYNDGRAYREAMQRSRDEAEARTK